MGFFAAWGRWGCGLRLGETAFSRGNGQSSRRQSALWEERIGKDMVNRDLLVTGALLHDIGKTKELSGFPTNEYTDPGQLLGHIIIGSQMIDRAAAGIQGFPEKLKNELIHLILSHHGEYEFGSPKKPALIEAIILAYVDNIDAKVETMHEAFMSKQPQNQDGWLGFNKLLDSNIRKTTGV